MHPLYHPYERGCVERVNGARDILLFCTFFYLKTTFSGGKNNTCVYCRCIMIIKLQMYNNTVGNMFNIYLVLI